VANAARMEEMGDSTVDSAMRLDESMVTSSDVRSLFLDLSDAVDFAVISTDAEGDSSSMTLLSLLFVPYTRFVLMSASVVSPDDSDSTSFWSPPRINASSDRHKTDRGDSLIIRADADVVNNPPLLLPV